MGTRVTKILQDTAANEWHYVSTGGNPADMASRGIYPGELEGHSVWWQGPSWLHGPTVTGIGGPSMVFDERTLEMKNIHTLATTLVLANTTWDILHRFSSFTTLTRVAAYCVRF